MNYKDAYNIWANDEFFGCKDELKNLSEKEIEDRFYQDLDFGTGGLRGLMGAGRNRMNKFTVGKATVGLGRYLLDKFGDEAKKRGVVICYDTRNNSASFAIIAANVLTSMGISVKLFIDPRPTPILSFATEFYRCLAGINITASHNPKEYNGYKAYNQYGCQLVTDEAAAVKASIDAISDYKKIDFSGNAELIELVDPTDDFVKAVEQRSFNSSDIEYRKKLKVVYTPLHGTGKVPVMQTLKAMGFDNVVYAKEQAIYDGNFTTAVSPNPENPEALALGISQAEAQDADLVLGTDPDCDRVGIAVKNKDGKFELMTGNQVGALLIDYILSKTEQVSNKKYAVINTIVTSSLGAEIARKHGANIFSTLTGFKYIGEKIIQFDEAKKLGESEKAYEYLFGYEESYGYLIGSYAKDKDAVGSSLYICEYAA